MAKNYIFLNKNMIKGLESYKYSSIDTNPLSIYIISRFNGWCVANIFPKWLAPNLMTLTGFLFTCINAALLSYYDFNFEASDPSSMTPPVPRWVWLFCAISGFLSHTLDGCDGMQAKKTKSSSPVGELFDHGLDSLATTFFTVSLLSIFGKAALYGPFTFLYMLLAVLSIFLMTHWEKYNTGIMYLPWGYDISQILITTLFTVSFLFGPEALSGNMGVIPFQFIEVLVYAIQANFWLWGLPLSLYNVFDSYSMKTGRMYSLTESLRPLIPMALLVTSTLIWAHMSPGNILVYHSRAYYFLFGFCFSNLACRLIIAQMSTTQADLHNPIVYLYAGVALLTIIFGSAYTEVVILYLMLAIVGLLHIIYSVIVVNELLDHFNLRAFKIPTQKTT